VMGGSGGTRTRIADRVVLPELARVDGAGRIDVVGATPLRVVVRPRAADLAARGMTAADIERRLQSIGRSLTAGRVREGAAVRPVVVAEPVRSVEELRNVAIDRVPLREVADVDLREIEDETRFSLSRDAGEGAAERRVRVDGVLLRAYRAPNANAVALAHGVRARGAEPTGRPRGLRRDVVVA